MASIKGLLNICKGIVGDNVLTFQDTENPTPVSLTDLLGGGLDAKAGSVSGNSFVSASGEKVYDVVFSSAFADTNYSIAITSTVERQITFSTKATTGFRINTNSNTPVNGETFDWTATKHGES